MNRHDLSIITALILSVGPTSKILAQDILWEKSYGGRHAEYLTDAVPTADYGFILAGSSLSGKTGNKASHNLGDLDYWVWKMDEKGEMEWQKTFGGPGTDFLQCIRLTRDGGFLLAGTSDSPKGEYKKADSRGGEDFWVIKLDAGGGEQWQKTIGGSGPDKLSSAATTKDGGYIIGGSSSSDKSSDKTSDSFGNMDYWILKLDKDGNIAWQQTFGGNYLDELRIIIPTSDGGYLAGGYSNSPDSGNKSEKNKGAGDFWIIKLNKDGQEEWQKTIGGNKDDELYAMEQTYDGGYVIGGNSNSGASYQKSKGNGKGTDFWVIKLDADGTIKWQEMYDFGTSDILTSIVENKDHTLLLGGFAKSEGDEKKDEKGINDYIALKISETGERLWDKIVGSDGDDILRKLVESRDGGYILAGTSNPLVQNKTIKKKKDKQSRTLPGMNVGRDQINSQLKNTTKNVNREAKKLADEVNDQFTEQITEGATAINEAFGSPKDSSLQYGLNTPTGNLLNAPTLNNDSDSANNGITNALEGLSNGSKNSTLPSSGDKQKNFGNSDFWVIKLKDNDKIKFKKALIEALPNPAGSYTNVIIGYDYLSGTATLVDLAGHILQTFVINGHTIPVNLSGYPEGIYIVNIITENGSEGIKIIKTGNQ